MHRAELQRFLDQHIQSALEKVWDFLPHKLYSQMFYMKLEALLSSGKGKFASVLFPVREEVHPNRRKTLN
jgi:hypothetical protein